MRGHVFRWGMALLVGMWDWWCDVEVWYESCGRGDSNFAGVDQTRVSDLQILVHLLEGLFGLREEVVYD